MQAWNIKTSEFCQTFSVICKRVSILISSSKKGIIFENVKQKSNSLLIYFSGSIPSAAAEGQQAGLPAQPYKEYGEREEVQTGLRTLPWAGQIPAPKTTESFCALQLLVSCIRQSALRWQSKSQSNFFGTV